ncbi:MAG: type II toxin-antitoxin system RelE/ParE family toxin [Deltaproteobacteria bacterium]|nr:type II toxin-antitoxin system RelE/ParE family toxin [Deltaproteobacteria bacterium]
MTFRVEIAPDAMAEVVSIAGWWRKNRPAAPRLFLQELDAAVVAIAERPEIGPRARLRRYPEARSYVLQRSRYVVLYSVDVNAERVIVVRVRHGRRRPLARPRRR